MRLVVSVMTVALCVGLAGCASMNPKNWNLAGRNPKKPVNDPSRISAAELERPAVPADPVSAGTPASRGPHNGLLAGQVINAFNQRQPGSMIQVSATDASPNESPQEVTANDQGYFMIQDLQPGRRYKLTARAKRGEQALAGTTIASPPNAVLVIRVSEDLAAPDMKDRGKPGATGSPAPPRSNAGASRSGAEHSRSRDGSPKYLHEPDRGFADRRLPTPGGSAPSPRLGAPTVPESSSEPVQPAVVRPELQTNDHNLARTTPGIPLNINGPLPPPSRAPALGEPLARSATGVLPTPNSTPAPVPSCTLSGNRLEEFALHDLTGRPYRFSEHEGKLVLLDFWGTWCPPCIQSLPHIAELHRRYGSRGLEVIGIAYEEGSREEQVERIQFVRQRQGVSYKLLLGAGEDCPVLTKLGVQKFPTLILLDSRGEILWRGEGLTPQNKTRLEAEIQKRLGP